LLDGIDAVGQTAASGEGEQHERHCNSKLSS
jgi:hypothetical protein